MLLFRYKRAKITKKKGTNQQAILACTRSFKFLAAKRQLVLSLKD